MDDSREALKGYLSSALKGEGPPQARGASALRVRCRLQAAGGPGAKVMPPTYSGTAGPVYVAEQRVMDGEQVPCVSLDSVASQANRMEDALAQAVAEGEFSLPTIRVNQGDWGVNSGLQFSHRCFDAWIEDAELDGQRFGESELWTQLVSVRRQRVTPLMDHFPVGIILGCWASRVRNPQGATRLARGLASEVIAVGAVEGQRAASKIDLHNVNKVATIYEAADGKRFTNHPEQAVKDKQKKAIPFGRAGRPGERGRPSEAGYGNVPPSTAAHGGITMDYALLISTLSLPALRECRFPDSEGHEDQARNVAGRLMLAALGLRMLSLLVEAGLDLRSGCLLVPEEEPTVELLGRLGQPVASWPLIEAPTKDLLAAAINDGKKHGLRWDHEDLHLEASDEQLELLRRSLAHQNEDGD